MDLHQTVQNALADLLSIAGLQHEDSWDASSGLGATAARHPQLHEDSALPRLSGHERPGPGPSACAAGRYCSTHAPSFGAPSLGPSGGAAAGEADKEEAIQEQDLPAVAEARLYQARLRAAQGELESMQAAVKAKDARLGGLEKEVQALRQA